jgi:hypothetical protein
MAARRTAVVIERGPESWVVVADGLGNEKHVMHVQGREELEKVWAIFRAWLAESAQLGSKRWRDPLDTAEVTT